MSDAPGWLYMQSEFGEHPLWTVGFHDGERWIAESDHESAESAAAQVHYLNGGTSRTPVPETTEGEALDAIQWKGSNLAECKAWLGDSFGYEPGKIIFDMGTVAKWGGESASYGAWLVRTSEGVSIVSDAVRAALTQPTSPTPATDVGEALDELARKAAWCLENGATNENADVMQGVLDYRAALNRTREGAVAAWNRRTAPTGFKWELIRLATPEDIAPAPRRTPR